MIKVHTSPSSGLQIPQFGEPDDHQSHDGRLPTAHRAGATCHSFLVGSDGGMHVVSEEQDGICRDVPALRKHKSLVLHCSLVRSFWES